MSTIGSDVTVTIFKEQGYTVDEIHIARFKAIPEYLENTKDVYSHNQTKRTNIWRTLILKHLENPGNKETKVK